MKEDDDKHTLVEEGTEFEGTLRAKCRVIVRGSVDGKLQAPAVDVAETGTVTGELQADRVRSHGILAGTIDAQEVSIAGTVRSDTVIRAKSLEVNLSAEEGKLEVTFGDCIVEVGDMPAEKSDSDEPSVDADAEAGSGKRKKGKGKPADAPAEEPVAAEATTPEPVPAPA